MIDTGSVDLSALDLGPGATRAGLEAALRAARAAVGDPARITAATAAALAGAAIALAALRTGAALPVRFGWARPAFEGEDGPPGRVRRACTRCASALRFGWCTACARADRAAVGSIVLGATAGAVWATALDPGAPTSAAALGAGLAAWTAFAAAALGADLRARVVPLALSTPWLWGGLLASPAGTAGQRIAGGAALLALGWLSFVFADRRDAARAKDTARARDAPERGFAGGDAAAGAALGAWLGVWWGLGAAFGAVASFAIARIASGNARIPGPFAGHLVAWGTAALAWRTLAG